MSLFPLPAFTRQARHSDATNAHFFIDNKGSDHQINLLGEQYGTGRAFLWVDDTRLAVAIALPKSPTPQDWRAAAASVVYLARQQSINHLHLEISDACDASALAEGCAIGGFDPSLYSGSAGKSIANPLSISLSNAINLDDFIKGEHIGMGIHLARILGHTPANIATPDTIQDTAAHVAEVTGMNLRCINHTEAEVLGMGGLLAVGRGSQHKPRLLILEHVPASAHEKSPLLLVGKGITFDTGGYSLKADGGKGMKADKIGACNILGAIYAIAKTQPNTHAIAILAVAENMIDANAYKVDDIITFCNGITCEVTNTDAEGRLVLADALAWGTATYQPRAVIDMATLTGGIITALGREYAGAFTSCTTTLVELAELGDSLGEPIWHMPLNSQYRNQMHAEIADLWNSAPVRDAHPVQGAAFLSHFVGNDAPRRMPDIPWIHLDIAGMSRFSKAVPPYPSAGPTGFGIRLLTAYAAQSS